MKKLNSFQIEDVIQNHRLYTEYHEYYKWVDGWDKDNKFINYYELMHLPELTGIPISGASILDVGCGTGDLSRFLRKRGMETYVGIDIYEPSLVKARKKYPEETFLYQDLLAEPLTQIFDYSFCSGTFTVKLSVNNYDFLETVLSILWQNTKAGIAFNVLTDREFPQDDQLFFYNVEKVLKLCKKVVKKGFVTTRPTEHVAQSHFYLYQ